MKPLQAALAETADATARLLDGWLAPMPGPVGRLVEAMRYGTLNGGKRLRPFLVVETAALFDIPRSQAIHTAAALEMVHCYSLIHDDLPAMDDSDLRRGRPTVHKEFDDATAILAGDGLLTEAFAVLADDRTHPDPAVRGELIAALAAAAGREGMAGGQMIDLSPERSRLDLDGIKHLQALKTGALITFACEAGAILGRAPEAARTALVAFAGHLGLAFQIVDDLLDAAGSAEELGKPTGQDSALGKATFVGQLGPEGARAEAEALIEAACTELAIFAEKAEVLRQTASFVLQRRS